jgi:hypothetical protein
MILRRHTGAKKILLPASEAPDDGRAPLRTSKAEGHFA